MKIRLLISAASREIIVIAAARIATVPAVITSNGYGKERVQSQHRASMGNISGLSSAPLLPCAPASERASHNINSRTRLTKRIKQANRVSCLFARNVQINIFTRSILQFRCLLYVTNRRIYRFLLLIISWTTVSEKFISIDFSFYLDVT